ncbi:MAG: hypothetical protein KIT35_26885 [Piscinibacter sp.]|uniref:hypothetical protein n=1 Tax=Piscinibacter TaxID=1114981 RepID=UPI000FDE012B|nr:MULTISPECIES: hypothetical protein [Piscinibacter]MCW5667477.1 hypothetical protein [Piscinibacter sp.]
MNAELHRQLRRVPRLAAGALLAGAAALAVAAPQDPPLPDLPPVEETAPDDDAPAAPAAPRGIEWQLWWQHLADRVFVPGLPASAGTDLARAALDLRLQWDLAPDWRAAWSSRLELVHAWREDPGAVDREQDLHSLREAWLSWRRDRAERSTFVDLGRINVRLGSASGFNPTDVFKTGAARAVSNADPRALRLDRLGVVMLRLQRVAPSGSLTLALAPRLSRREGIDERVFALALERTNGSAAALLKWSPQWSESVSVDGTLFQREGGEPQLGLSGSWLASRSVVLYAEWAGGRRVGLVGPDEATPAPSWRHRLTAGGTYTAPAGWELGAELQHAGDALSRDAWQRWREAGTGADALRLAQLAQQRAYEREPLVRTGLFVRAAWRRAFDLPSLNLGGYLQANGYDRSRLWQLRADWRLDRRWTLTGLVGAADGAAGTEFGTYNPRRHLSVVLAYLH